METNTLSYTKGIGKDELIVIYGNRGPFRKERFIMIHTTTIHSTLLMLCKKS